MSTENSAPEYQPGEAMTVETEAVKPAQPTFDPGFMQRIMDRAAQQITTSIDGTKEVVPRKYVTFDVPADACSSLITEDFKLTLRSLTSVEEEQALIGVQDPAGAVGRLVRKSMHKVNGTLLTENAREFLWEALHAGGRLLAMERYSANYGAVSPEQLKKVQETSTRS